MTGKDKSAQLTARDGESWKPIQIHIQLEVDTNSLVGVPLQPRSPDGAQRG